MSIKLKGTTAGSAVILAAPTDTSPTGTEKTFTLPTQDGDAGQILKTDGSGALSFTDNLASNRNIVINGAMQISQRSTSVTGVADNSDEGYQTLDRYALYFSNSAGGVCTVSQATDVPSNEGFSSSYKVDVTTADTSVDATHMIYVAHKIEAQNVRNSGWNYTSTSSYVTLSFWVKSSKAGTYCVAARANDAGAVYYPFEYTLAANTWKKVTHSFPGDSSLVINNDNGVGFELRWYLVAGTDRNNGTANQWNADNTQNAATSNQVNFFDSTSNDFYLTGVQLEVGEAATSFEHRSYGDELHRCRRYFQTSFPSNPSTTNTDNNGLVMYGGSATAGTTSFIGTARIELNPPMRAAPSVTIYDIANPRNTTKLHRHTFGQVGSNNQSAVPTNISANSFNVRSDNGSSATGILFQYKVEAEL